MAITQLTNIEDTSGSIDIAKDRLLIIYKIFATNIAIKCWYFVLAIWIFIFILFADIEIYFHKDSIGQWGIRSSFFIWILISLILIIGARNMRDHFALMAEMKV